MLTLTLTLTLTDLASSDKCGGVPTTCKHVSVLPNRTTGSFPAWVCRLATVAGPTGADPSNGYTRTIAALNRAGSTGSFPVVQRLAKKSKCLLTSGATI